MGVKIRQKDGAWWVFINHRGRRKAKRIGVGEPGKRAAKGVAEKIQAKLALGDVGILDDANGKVAPTFAEVAAQWERVKAPEWKKGTVDNYAGIITRHLIPAFGGKPIANITVKDVEPWWTGVRTDGYSRTRLTSMRSILLGIFQRALDDDLVTKNPAERIKGRLGKQDAEIQQIAYLTQEHLNAALAASERVCPGHYPLHLVMATAGLRLGEALALRVGDLDAPALQIHVRRAYRKGHVSSPKNGRVRVVDVGGTTMQALVKVREIRQAEAAVRGTEARWLFPSPTGDKPLSDFAVRRALKKALKAASLPGVKNHTLRHTYASLELQAGVPLLTVSRQLGHAGISTTADIYGHLGPQSNRVAAEAMEAILTGNPTQPPRNLTA